MAQEILEQLPPASTCLYVMQQQQQQRQQQELQEQPLQGHTHRPQQQPGAGVPFSCSSAAEGAAGAGAGEAGMASLTAHGGAGPAGQGGLGRGPLPEAVAVCYRWRPGMEFKVRVTPHWMHR